MGWFSWRHQRRERVRRGTAALRGAALAVAAAAAAVTEQLGAGEDCPEDDVDCLTGAYADLVRKRRRVADVADEVQRLERSAVHYDGRVPGDAPRLGGQLPTVIAARAMVDAAHDSVLEALGAARDALTLLDADVLLDGAPG